MIPHKILKFGGSSVGSTERIRGIIDLVRDVTRYPPGTVLGVVVSAFQGVTDALIDLTAQAAVKEPSYNESFRILSQRHLDAVQSLVPATVRSPVIASVKVMLNELEELLHGIEILKECSPRTKDHVLSFGERLSSYIVAQAFTASDYPAEALDSRQVVFTNDSYGNAVVDRTKTYAAIQSHFAQLTALPIIAGFIGSTPTGASTTLGRGGSDLSAALFGAALEVDEIEIWTDVDGMLTSDPRKVPKAFPIPEVTFEEAMELSHFGAKVIYPPTMQPAIDAHIPLIIKNTLNPDAPGTRIVEHAIENPYPLTGISSISRIALLRLQGSGMVGVTGTAARFFKALASSRINVILITQASSEHTICCAIDPQHVESANAAVKAEFALELQLGLIDPLVIEQELSIVSVVGENMRNTPGVAGRAFSALGSNGVNIIAVAQGSSERNISTVVSSSDELKALNAIHDEFFVNRTKTINLWVVGTGLIGSTLLKQLNQQYTTLRETSGIEIKLRGVSNSRQMRLCSKSSASIPFDELLGETLGSDAITCSLPDFITDCATANLPNTIFVDCTASDDIPAYYPRLLDLSIAVVTPNKRAFSNSMQFYAMLRKAANKRRTPLLHETCVGAALPVLGTLSDLVRSGDSVVSIDAVLSGTLSFIFNSMSLGVSFSEAVKEAKLLGYTEPDPRDDLSGIDVARKVLILARDAGLSIELEEIERNQILPNEALDWTEEEFMAKLPILDPHFSALINAAKAEGQRLFFGAKIDCLKGSARIGIQSVSLDHPFCALSGADNMVAFTTTRYRSNPLVVKGPGAGAEVTAAGVFADIIRAAR